MWGVVFTACVVFLFFSFLFFSFLFFQDARVLEGRHGGLVGTKAWRRRMGHVCCMGMIMGLCLVFYAFFCKPVDVVEGISLRACCSDGGVCKVGVGCTTVMTMS
jgi:hypothetical protein